MPGLTDKDGCELVCTPNKNSLKATMCAGSVGKLTKKETTCGKDVTYGGGRRDQNKDHMGLRSDWDRALDIYCDMYQMDQRRDTDSMKVEENPGVVGASCQTEPDPDVKCTVGQIYGPGIWPGNKRKKYEKYDKCESNCATNDPSFRPECVKASMCESDNKSASEGGT